MGITGRQQPGDQLQCDRRHFPFRSRYLDLRARREMQIRSRTHPPQLRVAKEGSRSEFLRGTRERVITQLSRNDQTVAGAESNATQAGCTRRRVHSLDGRSSNLRIMKSAYRLPRLRGQSVSMGATWPEGCLNEGEGPSRIMGVDEVLAMVPLRG